MDARILTTEVGGMKNSYRQPPIRQAAKLEPLQMRRYSPSTGMVHAPVSALHITLAVMLLG